MSCPRASLSAAFVTLCDSYDIPLTVLIGQSYVFLISEASRRSSQATPSAASPAPENPLLFPAALSKQLLAIQLETWRSPETDAVVLVQDVDGRPLHGTPLAAAERTLGQSSWPPAAQAGFFNALSRLSSKLAEECTCITVLARVRKDRRRSMFQACSVLPSLQQTWAQMNASITVIQLQSSCHAGHQLRPSKSAGRVITPRLCEERRRDKEVGVNMAPKAL
jgi:hypothetical protein